MPTFLCAAAIRAMYPDVEESILRVWALTMKVRTGEGGWCLEDIETILAGRVESMFAHDGWMDYTGLWNEHGIKRGWLDTLVSAGGVRTMAGPDGDCLYLWPDIASFLRKNPTQRLPGIRRLGRW